MDERPRAMPTPCTGVCTLDAHGICHGCLRSLAEISDWSRMSDARRQWLMDVELPARGAARG